MKVQKCHYLRRQALELIPETLEESNLLRDYLGSDSPLRLMGSLAELKQSSPGGPNVFLWHNHEYLGTECPPEQDKPSQMKGKVTRKKADLGAFMNALHRYVNAVVSYRVRDAVKSVDDIEDSDRFLNEVNRTSTELQEVVKPLFEEEVH